MAREAAISSKGVFTNMTGKAPSAVQARAVETAVRNQAGRPTLVELERRKLLILEIATNLFVRQGYAETSLVDIADKAGVATRTLYQHFGDKEGIFRDVIYARRSARLIPAPQLAEGVTLRAALLELAHLTMDYVLFEHNMDLMRLMVAEGRRFPELMSRVANATFARFTANVKHVFEELAKRQQIPQGDHEESARFFLDLLLGSVPILNYTGWDRTRPDDATLAKKVDLFILGRFGAAVAQKADMLSDA